MVQRILLADDHQIVRQGLRTLLEREGYEIVAEASNGPEAIQLARDTRPDIVVLDLAMPLMNGLDAAREIRKNSTQTKVILLTMYAEDHYVLEALQGGVSGYVLKTQAAP
ncbi:MAG TPA: response regulator transcription factor, partial [bacterium]|nr:response regulator transcription factor [bacterium]